MARDRKSNAEHVADGTYRPGRHAGPLTPHEDDGKVRELVARWEAAFDAAAADVEANGSTIHTDGGRVMMNPAARQMAAASAELRHLYAALGATPAARRSLGMVAAAEDDDDSELQQQLAGCPPRLRRP